MEKPKINYYNKILKELTEFIKEKAGGRPVAIGLSGGIDSTLCAFLAYRALGKKNIHGILSPSRYTPEEDMEHVMKFAHKICGKIIKIKRGEIDKIREAYEHALPWKDENERIVLDAYIRNTLLRRYSRREGVRLLGTINGTEWKIGYYPKYSLIGDFLPIAGLFKTEVFELAEILNLPREIIEKKPTLGINRRSGYGCDPKDITQRKSKIDVELIKTGLNYNCLLYTSPSPRDS